MQRIVSIVTSKLGILLILMVLMYVFRRTNLVYLFMVSVVVWIYYHEIRDGMQRIGKCLKFLFVDAFFISLFISLLTSVRLNFIEDSIVKMIIVTSVFVLIFCMLYIVIAFSAEKETAKLTILIVTTFVSIIYLVVTTIINIIPLSAYTDFFLQYTNKSVLEVVLSEYDGRIIANILVQILIYPMWIAALIGGTIVAWRDYCKEKKDNLEKYDIRN